MNVWKEALIESQKNTDFYKHLYSVYLARYQTEFLYSIWLIDKDKSYYPLKQNALRAKTKALVQYDRIMGLIVNNEPYI